MNRWQVSGLVLVVGFALLGVAVFAAWWWERSDHWMVAGVFVLWAGVVATPAALGLAAKGWLVSRRAGEPWARRWWPTLTIVAVFVANFPLAWLLQHVALREHTRFTVVVHNTAAEPWADVVLEGGGARAALAPLAAGERAAVDLWFRTDGALTLRAATGDPVEVEGYVTNGWGGARTVVRHTDGRVAVQPAAK